VTGAASAARRLGRDWPALLGLAVIILSTVAAMAAPVLAPTDPVKNDLLARLTPPMWVAGGDRAHPLGTDTLGRDVLSRLLYGARVSLVIGLTAVVLAGAAGVALGLIAGYYRGWLDDVLMRVGDIQLAFPVLLLGVALLSVLGASLGNLIAVATIGVVISLIYNSQVSIGTPLARNQVDQALRDASIDGFRVGMIVAAGLAFAGAAVAAVGIVNREDEPDEVSEQAPAPAGN